MKYQYSSITYLPKAPSGRPYFVSCASCDSDCMHQADVEVFRRDEEDSEMGMHLLTRGIEYVRGERVSGNPSSRRDAVRIIYTCEQCDMLTIMELVQHKGTETLEFHCRPRRMDEEYL